MRTRSRCAAALIGVSTLGLLAAASETGLLDRQAQLSLERQREILREALTAFDEAVAVVRDNPAQAEALYRRSAAAFETLTERGISNAAIEYNLGNAYFRLGELGRAILHYRRSQRLEPNENALTANLQYARNRVEPYIEPGGGQKLIARLMFWTNRTSIQDRFRIALIASTAGWLGLALRLRWRSRPLAALAALAILLGIANSGSVAWQLHHEATTPPAVVVDGEHVLRLGRGEGYDPALTQPLGPGVELHILSERGEWVEVRLLDGKTGWLPTSATARI
jgi:tetratricopeptide (TPR) repeat protein